MLRIGLTGGVGCGKSTVAKLFEAMGAIVLDADQIARELVEPGKPALAAIVAEFGQAVLVDGRLDRKALRERVYSDKAAKQALESLIHPLVYQTLGERSKELREPYCIFAIPLLIENGRRSFVDRVLVVDCAPEQQVERVRKRDGLDDDVIERIIRAQATRREKLAAADDIIENSGDIAQLREQVEKLHLSYRSMAKSSNDSEALPLAG